MIFACNRVIHYVFNYNNRVTSIVQMKYACSAIACLKPEQNDVINIDCNLWRKNRRFSNRNNVRSETGAKVHIRLTNDNVFNSVSMSRKYYCNHTESIQFNVTHINWCTALANYNVSIFWYLFAFVSQIVNEKNKYYIYIFFSKQFQLRYYFIGYLIRCIELWW